MKFKHSVIILSLTTSIILAGCGANTGNQKIAKKSTAELQQMVTKGVSTKNDVVAMFGEPDDTDILADGRNKYIYVNIKRDSKFANYIPGGGMLFGGTNDTAKKIVILFDKNDVVESVSASTSQGETKTGVFR